MNRTGDDALAEIAWQLKEFFPMVEMEPSARRALRHRLVTAALQSRPAVAAGAPQRRPWLMGAAFLSLLGLAWYARRSGWHLPELSVPLVPRG